MLISTKEEYDVFLKKLRDGPALTVYDLETTGLDPFKRDRLIGVAILIPDDMEGDKASGESFYMPFRHMPGKNLPIECLYSLAPFLADPDRILVGFNIKFDVHFTEAERITVHNRLADVMLAAHLANENEMSFALKRLGTKYVGVDASKDEKELLAKLKSRKLGKGDMRHLLPEEVAPYAEQDVRLTWQLAKLYSRNLETQNIHHLWPDVNKYLEATVAMERRGILVDQRGCAQALIEARKCQAELYEKMKAIVGKEFNPNSVPQMRVILGQQKTDKEAMAKCSHPVARLLIQSRSWEKAAGTFYQGFLDSIGDDLRIHPNLDLKGTISGRLSCKKPNLQALPKGNSVHKIRDLIIAPPGHVLMSWDWSQAELRLLAHYAGDAFLVGAFKDEKDIHQETAIKLNIARDFAKRINFGVVYGVGSEALSRELDISKVEAKEYLDRYHRFIPGVRKLYKIAQQVAVRDRKIPMWTGRLRHYREEDATYKALSNLIQGGVAEMMRVAITRLHDIMTGTSAHQVLQVHDEILFEIPEQETAYWSIEIKRIMEDFEFNVPIVAEGKIGYSWGAGKMHPIEFDEGGQPTVPDFGHRDT